MFGSKPYHPSNTNTQDSTQFILDKIHELDLRLTNQIACPHTRMKYEPCGGVLGASNYFKKCALCDLQFGVADHAEKQCHDYEEAKAKVEEYEGKQEASNLPPLKHCLYVAKSAEERSLSSAYYTLKTAVENYIKSVEASKSFYEPNE